MLSIKKYRINELAALTVLVLYFYIFKVKENQTYFESKYWLGVSKNTIMGLIPLQILAGIGILIWYINIRKIAPDKGILSYTFLNNPMYDILIFFVLFGSILWPLSLLQNKLIEEKTMTKSLLCCSGLFIAGISGILLQAGSFEADNISPISLIGLTLFNTTVILNDSIGWCARLIYQTLYNKQKLFESSNM